MLEPIVQQCPLGDIKPYYLRFLEGVWLAICAEMYAFLAIVNAARVGKYLGVDRPFVVTLLIPLGDMAAAETQVLGNVSNHGQPPLFLIE